MNNQEWMIKMATLYANEGNPKGKYDPIFIEYGGETYLQIGRNASHEFFARVEHDTGKVWQLSFDCCAEDLESPEAYDLLLVENPLEAYWGHF